mmetsp:Transcript_14276/g.21440  ORF Transcript_14276/g.21440 Transcript_14276/m.21440 type:complete len:130 (+) Transcript_14276:53-442(+)
MPESHKAERRRAQKQNIAAGIGDENGRITRVKAAAPVKQCVECQHELKITKTNTELKLHSENKHGKTIEHCFPGAEAISAEMQKPVKGTDSKPEASKGKKKAPKEDLGALFDAGLSGGPGAKKKFSKKR